MRAREGDIVEAGGAFFDVKGLVHPPGKVVAFIRFLPDQRGDREKGGITYRKIFRFSERYLLLKEKFPQYLAFDPVFDEHLCEIQVEDIKHHYEPVDRLHELRSRDKLDEVEKLAASFIELLKGSAGVRWGSLGISGSILIKLHTPTSDIDPIVYGSENCRKVHSALRALLGSEESSIRPYDLEGLRNLFDFRSKDTIVPFEDFVRTESRKVLQGKFLGRDYFVRCVKDWDEIKKEYGANRYISRGYAKIKAKIADDSEAIFTPCRYKIENVRVLGGVHIEPIEEVVSFRGRFCEQAKNGKRIIAQGKVEQVKGGWEREYCRLLIGNKSSDFMILAR